MQDPEEEIKNISDQAADENGNHLSDENLDDDDVVEFEYNADGEEDLKATLKKLRKQLKDTQKEKADYLTSWQRERADFMNYKKSEGDQSKRVVAKAREQFAEELLPVLDAYDMAFAHKEAWEKVDKNWRTGVEYIHQQLLKVLSENGIEEIAVNIGDAIDPNLHEAMSTIAVDSAPSDGNQNQVNTVAQVIQKGYKSGEKVFRPARVVVYEAK